MSHRLALGLWYGLGISLACNLLQPRLNRRPYPAVFAVSPAPRTGLDGHSRVLLLHLVSEFLPSAAGAASQVLTSLSVQPLAQITEVWKPFSFVLSRFWGYLKAGNFPAGLVNDIVLCNICTVKEVLETNISIIPFGEHLPLSFGSLRKKKKIYIEKTVSSCGVSS